MPNYSGMSLNDHQRAILTFVVRKVGERWQVDNIYHARASDMVGGPEDPTGQLWDISDIDGDGTTDLVIREFHQEGSCMKVFKIDASGRRKQIFSGLCDGV